MVGGTFFLPSWLGLCQNPAICFSLFYVCNGSFLAEVGVTVLFPFSVFCARDILKGIVFRFVFCVLHFLCFSEISALWVSLTCSFKKISTLVFHICLSSHVHYCLDAKPAILQALSFTFFPSSCFLKYLKSKVLHIDRKHVLCTTVVRILQLYKFPNILHSEVKSNHHSVHYFSIYIWKPNICISPLF